MEKKRRGTEKDRSGEKPQHLEHGEGGGDGVVVDGQGHRVPLRDGVHGHDVPLQGGGVVLRCRVEVVVQG